MLQALIVDDSKTARYALKQLLARHHFAVDTVESAEDALEYLNNHTPDLIFMDHMMPGMDGFQAVKAIKSTPATHNIPIVMYTSTQDGVYFGQARALGAADVILKPATAADLAAVLERLERHGQLGSGEPLPAPLIELPEMADEMAEEEPVAAEAREAAATIDNRQRSRFNALAMGLVLLVVVLGWVLLQVAVERDRLLVQKQRAIAALEWALNDRAEFAYGDKPFGAARVQQLRELLEHLEAIGFRGLVRLESHVGEFCTVHDTRRGGWVLAPDALPLTECGALGQSEQAAQRASELETAAFRRFLTRASVLRSGAIRVELAGFGAREPLLEYPADPDVSAGVWNRIAQRNQRLVYRITAENEVREAR